MSDNQRGENRVEQSFRFVAHVHESAAQPHLAGMSLQCEAIDFSAHGMQFSTHSELNPGSMVDLTIAIGEPVAQYLLRGEVRWTRQVGASYRMGVMIKPAEDTDYQQWTEAFRSDGEA